MNNEGMRERCEEMTILELLRSTTTDRDQYDPAFIEIAQVYLNRQWSAVQELKNRARVQWEMNPAEDLIKEDVLGIVKKPVDLWQTGIIMNCLDDMLILQRERDGWTVHLVIKDEYEGSFRIGSDSIRRVIEQFMEIDYRDVKRRKAFDISTMAVLLETESFDYAAATTDILETKHMEYVVQTRILARIFQDEESSAHAVSFIVLVPASIYDDAMDVIDDMESMIAALHEDADQYSAEGNTPAELETYERIVRLVPTDHIAAFNLGAAYFESQQYDEAVEEFGRVLLMAGSTATDDVEEYCVEIVSRIPDNIGALHILADIERLRGNTGEATAYIKRILQINESDAIAHMNLGYLLYEESDDDSEARSHLRRYLELKPDADDRETIETMISELK